MGSNPPIRAVPTQVAQPNLHIARFISGLRPHLAEHAYRGATYFVRSRAGGDTLCEEDWNPNYVPPTFDPVTLAKLLHARSRSALSSPSSDRSNISDKPIGARPLRDTTHNVDPERCKHALRALAQRASPYPKRKLADLHHSQQRHQPPPNTTITAPNNEQLMAQLYGYTPPQEAAAASLAQLQLAFAQAQATRQQKAQPTTDHTTPALNHLLELGARFNAEAAVAAAAPKQAPRLTLPYGIFARGVASQPVKVQQQQQQTAVGFDEKRFLGLAQDPAVGAEKTSSPNHGRHDSSGGFAHHNNPTSPMSPAAAGVGSQLSPGEPQASPILDSILPFYGITPGPNAPWPSAPNQQPPTMDTLAAMLEGVPSSQWPLTPDNSQPIQSSNVHRQPYSMGRAIDSWAQRNPQPAPPTQEARVGQPSTPLGQPTTPLSYALPTPPADLFDSVQVPIPTAEPEQRAVSADPPRIVAPDWQRPLSAPPSKAPTPPSLPHVPVIQESDQPLELQPAWLDEPLVTAKSDPKPDPEPTRNLLDWPWAGLDGANLFTDLSWLPSPVSHPEPYSYGLRSDEPTVGPTNSSPFLSPFHPNSPLYEDQQPQFI